jgi:hypothetical protein
MNLKGGEMGRRYVDVLVKQQHARLRAEAAGTWIK